MSYPGSDFGTNLAVVAPGTNVATCVRTGQGTGGGDYITNFIGTSASAPFVAGIAALILSSNPCLTNEQVSTAIEQTCNKVDATVATYSNTTGRPNGTWSTLHGYGLVNAYAALNFANTTWLQNATETGTATRDNLGNVKAGFDVNPNLPTGDYIISSGANITIKSANAILFEPGFAANAGSLMDAFIAPFAGDCSPWEPEDKLDRIVPASTDSTGANFNAVTSFPNGNTIVIFPNPFANDIKIDFNIAEGQTPVTVIITDILGNLVCQNSSSFESGNHELHVSINSSASVFIAKVYVGNQCNVQKLVKYATN